ASADVKGQVRVHDLNTGRPLEGLPAKIDEVNCLAFSPGGRWVAFGCDGGTVYLLDLPARRGEDQRGVEDRSDVVSAICAPAGRALACGGKGAGLVRLWDHRAGQAVRDFKGHKGSVWGLDFAPGGELLVSASWDHTVKVWESATGRLRETLLGHVEAVKYAAFAPRDASLLATGSRDGTVKLWRLPSGQQPGRGAAGAVGRVLGGSGGPLLVWSGGRVQAWDLDEGKPVTLPAPLSAALRSASAVAVSSDGRWYAVGDRRGAVRVLDGSGA